MLRHYILLPFLTASLLAQGPVEAGANERIAQERVTELLTHLASDGLAGRGTPSRGQDLAASYISEAFRKAGLKAPFGGSYFQTFERPGLVVDSTKVELRLHIVDGAKPVVLEGGKDVKVYSAPIKGFAADDAKVTLVDESKAIRLRRAAPRQPILLVVDEKKSVLWQSVEAVRRKLKGRRFSRAPILLVRKAALPEQAIDFAEVFVPEAKAVSIELKNVVGILPGVEGAEEFVMLSAHYDHLGVGLPQDGDAVYNGADDDATGTTAVLALAEAYSKAAVKPKRNLVFVCFTAEESGMLGSKAFCAKPPFPLAKIAANLNIEMIGRPEDIGKQAAWITGKEYSDFAEISSPALKRAGIGLVEHQMARMLFSGSDNISLARKGVVAHSISAGSLHRDYHKATDEIRKIDIPNMTSVIRGLYELGLEFANRAERPSYNQLGRQFLKLD